MQSQDTTTAAKTATIAKVLTYTHEGTSFFLGLTEKGDPRWVSFGQDFKPTTTCARAESDFLHRAAEANPEDKALNSAAAFSFYAQLSDDDKQAMQALQLLIIYRARLAGKAAPEWHPTPNRVRQLQEQLHNFIEKHAITEDPHDGDFLESVKGLLALPTE